MENKQQHLTPAIVVQPNSANIALSPYADLSLAIADLRVEALETRLSMIICDFPGCVYYMEHGGRHSPPSCTPQTCHTP